MAGLESISRCSAPDETVNSEGGRNSPSEREYLVWCPKGVDVTDLLMCLQMGKPPPPQDAQLGTKRMPSRADLALDPSSASCCAAMGRSPQFSEPQWSPYVK